jgi:hypothetical protein
VKFRGGISKRVVVQRGLVKFPKKKEGTTTISIKIRERDRGEGESMEKWGRKMMSLGKK